MPLFFLIRFSFTYKYDCLIRKYSVRFIVRFFKFSFNKGKYKCNAKPSDNPDYITGRPDEETYQRVKLYLLHQFTTVGAPHIWNGDEMGMWGGDDPDCRKPLWWPEYNFEPENIHSIFKVEKEYVPVGFNTDMHQYYKQMTKLRNNNPVLSNGKLEFVKAEGKLLGYTRTQDDEKVLVILNAGDGEAIYHLVKGKQYKNLLTGEAVEQDVVLKPITGLVLKEL